MKVSVGVSNHHMHLTKEVYEQVTGNSELIIRNDLTQTGEFASTTTLTIIGPKGQIDNVRVLGPFRKYNQVEISKTDAYLLGVNPPIRKSGDLIGSSPITIVGPKGQVSLEEGCILAERHIHLSNQQLQEMGFYPDQEVQISIDGEKGGILNHVKIKPGENYVFELHLDTDDANAHLLKNGDEVEII